MPESNIARNRDKDALAFGAQVTECLRDKRIARYFERNHVQAPIVTERLVKGPAFAEAINIPAYISFTQFRLKLQKEAQQEQEFVNRGVVRLKTKAILGALCVLAIILLLEFSTAHFETFATSATSMLFSSTSGAMLARAFHHELNRWRNLAFSFLAFVLAASIINVPHFALAHPWDPETLYIIFTLSSIVGWFLGSTSTLEDVLSLISIYWLRGHISYLSPTQSALEQRWLEACVAPIIIPHAVLAINTILGEEQHKVLVEQDSEGLRRLLDPSFRVETRSHAKIASILSQMDSASVAVAGPRGVGKSTLLKQFTTLEVTEQAGAGISVYVTAPAEYIPRDFIAEVFQRLCEAYLKYHGSKIPESAFTERQKRTIQQGARKLLAVCWLLLRTLAALAIIAWIAKPFITAEYPGVREAILTTYDHGVRVISEHLQLWWINYRLWLSILIILFALLLLPYRGSWRRYIGRRTESPLTKTAREHLTRLSMDKTVTYGATLSSPTIRGLGVGVSKGGILKYSPWTLPELVSHIRQFMLAVSEELTSSEHAIIVGIDEIDRIGSVDHAQRFIGEIKSIFGVERCFFLVAVAEDVSSLFAQRAMAGRSILENAFDDVTVVEPLTLEEAIDFLLKRVPGFTVSFAYLVQALSGGLPRELIRVTRRLVKLNLELQSGGWHHRLEDLAFALVREELSNTLRGYRNQLSRLRLDHHWTGILDELQSASTDLRYGDAPPVKRADYSVIRHLSELTPPVATKGRPKAPAVREDEDSAKTLLADLATASYFGLTVIDAFSDAAFDSYWDRRKWLAGTEESYEQLAIIRSELSLSTASSRSMIQRFRESINVQ